MKRLLTILLLIASIAGLGQNNGGDYQRIKVLEKGSFDDYRSIDSDLEFAPVWYVNQTVVGAISKDPVDVATTEDIALSGMQTIDGYLPPEDSARVLVKDQANTAQNGLYLMLAGSWVRTTDMDAWAKIYKSSVFVQNGTDNTGSTYTSFMEETGTLGSDPINWNITSKIVFPTFAGYKNDSVRYKRGRVFVYQHDYPDSTAVIYTEGSLTESVTGLNVTGAGKTLNGSLEIGIDAGRAIPTTTELNNASTAYLSRITGISITGTGNTKTLNVTIGSGATLQYPFSIADGDSLSTNEVDSVKWNDVWYKNGMTLPITSNAAHTGAVTGSTALTITNDSVTNAKLANMVTARIKGRATAGTGDPEDLTASQVKTMLALNNVDNTSDLNKPVSTAQETAINANIAQAITNGVTTSAPSQDVVFDALALKLGAADVSGKEDKSNKITTMFAPTHTQYPSAKLLDSLLALKANLISPTLVTPDIGTAIATSINKVTISVAAPATGAILTIADNKQLSVTNNATLSGTNTGDQNLSYTAATRTVAIDKGGTSAVIPLFSQSGTNAGLVNGSVTGDSTKVLRGDNTWGAIGMPEGTIDTVYSEKMVTQFMFVNSHHTDSIFSYTRDTVVMRIVKIDTVVVKEIQVNEIKTSSVDTLYIDGRPFKVYWEKDTYGISDSLYNTENVGIGISSAFDGKLSVNAPSAVTTTLKLSKQGTGYLIKGNNNKFTVDTDGKIQSGELTYPITDGEENDVMYTDGEGNLSLGALPAPQQVYWSADPNGIYYDSEFLPNVAIGANNLTNAKLYSYTVEANKYAGYFDGTLGLYSNKLKVGSTGSTITRTGTMASYDFWTGTQAEWDANTEKNGVLPQATTTFWTIKD